MSREAERRWDHIRDSANVMIAVVNRNATTMRMQVGYHWREVEMEIKEIRERVERIRLKRLTLQEEKLGRKATVLQVPLLLCRKLILLQNLLQQSCPLLYHH